ncbi:hypothetical protein PLICRDRAFT_180935 [Plicaturopsis crispa FD-325 SS-3]|uniref:Uncharacterized protein n=1 Tax=Plicaturopsis crispa FD-325 SS-3 TaxID=944288 RepID=A0A0C9T134_PLICR|nr:hypothetical protein PLICRDRAFT_180935 [Plicaturopsis crispa FD-325 SS-3]
MPPKRSTRTKQTAQKSTGGSAPRRALDQLPSPVVEHAGEANASKETIIEESDDYCFVCVDGGHLNLCSLCPRAVCNRCVTVPKDLPEDVVFICPCCHEAKEVLRPYFGLYRSMDDFHEGHPLFPNDKLRLNQAYQLSAKARVCTMPTIIFNFRISSISGPETVGPAVLQQLKGYYLAEKGLMYIDLPFRIESRSDRERFTRGLDKHVDDLNNMRTPFQRVLLLITTHSDHDRGDLFTYMDPEDQNKSWALQVHQFSEAIFTDKFCNYVSTKLATGFLFACGAVVTKEESHKELKDMAARLHLDDMLAFGAPHFHPILTWAYIAESIQQFVIERKDMSAHLASFMTSSVGGHTSICHIAHEKGQVESALYVYANRAVRPYGMDLPPQCPECCCLRPWKAVPQPLPEEKKKGDEDFTAGKLAEHQISDPDEVRLAV